MRALVLVSVLVFGLGAFSAMAADEEYTYVGVKKCKMCHKKPETGAQFAIWSESAHAKAFEVLATEEAKADAAAKGIEDPQTAPECLMCHVTAFPVMADIANQKITMEEGVSCESCHGAGSAYYKKKTMTAISAGEVEGATVGLTEITAETCTVCHTAEGNSFYKEFDFEKFTAEIAHPTPEAGEAAAE